MALSPCGLPAPSMLVVIRLEGASLLLLSEQNKACLPPIHSFVLIVLFPCACALLATPLLPGKQSADHPQMVHTEVSVLFCFNKDPR